MKYPAVSNWVSYSESNNGSYMVYDEAFDHTYRMSPMEFDFFRRLDGKTNPYKIPSDLTREEKKIFLDYLEQNYLIRRSRVLAKSPGNVFITLFSTKTGGASKRKAASAADRMLSILWLPVLLTSIFYLLEHAEAVTGPDCLVSGSAFGIITGIVCHELGHVAACLHYGGKLFEFGVGFHILPCAYVLLNTDSIRSRQKRAHVNAAGIETNLLLTGIYLYLSCFLPRAGGFLLFAAIQNIIFALLNLVFLKGIDGMGIISEFLGCDDLFQYAKETVVSRERRRKLCQSGINGLVTMGVCYIALLMQIGFPLLVAGYLVFLIL